MLVVADSSPLNFIIRLGNVDSLPRLFEAVAIPPQVAEELSHMRTPKAVRDFMVRLPQWLTIRSPMHIETIPGVDPGEAAAISLARELKADLLLIDDREGRKAAVKRHIPVTGTIGVLERAAQAGLLDLPEAFHGLKEQPDFWVDHKLLDQRLALFLRQKP